MDNDDDDDDGWYDDDKYRSSAAIFNSNCSCGTRANTRASITINKCHLYTTTRNTTCCLWPCWLRWCTIETKRLLYHIWHPHSWEMMIMMIYQWVIMMYGVIWCTNKAEPVCLSTWHKPASFDPQPFVLDIPHTFNYIHVRPINRTHDAHCTMLPLALHVHMMHNW